jgi:hypothetical protein
MLLITNKSIQSEGKKMATERCTNLIAKGMYHKVDEMWISDQPFLLFTYMNVYAPWLTRQMFKIVGPMRVKVLREGGNIYDVKVIITTLVLLIFHCNILLLPN